MANNFTLPPHNAGKVKARVSGSNHGLRAAWFDACYTGSAGAPFSSGSNRFRSDDEYCFIVEDDLELSPFWYVWLRKAWRAYRDRGDVAGIALSVRTDEDIWRMKWTRLFNSGQASRSISRFSPPPPPSPFNI